MSRRGYDAGMNWSARFQSDPRFGQAVRFATGRPPWVLKATGVVGGIVFLIPLIALVVLLIGAFAVTAVAWFVFSTIARVIDAITGQGRSPEASPPADEPQDGRENVRVIHRS